MLPLGLRRFCARALGEERVLAARWRRARTIRDMRFGAESMLAPLREVLVKRPGAAFGRAYDDPAHGFLHAVDLSKAQRQHDELSRILTELGVVVNELEAETESPDLVYVFDPAVVAAAERSCFAPASRTGGVRRPSSRSG